jgi:hypothetical protein
MNLLLGKRFMVSSANNESTSNLTNAHITCTWQTQIVDRRAAL